MNIRYFLQFHPINQALTEVVLQIVVLANKVLTISNYFIALYRMYNLIHSLIVHLSTKATNKAEGWKDHFSFLGGLHGISFSTQFQELGRCYLVRK